MHMHAAIKLSRSSRLRDASANKRSRSARNLLDVLAVAEIFRYFANAPHRRKDVDMTRSRKNVVAPTTSINMFEMQFSCSCRDVTLLSPKAACQTLSLISSKKKKQIILKL